MHLPPVRALIGIALMVTATGLGGVVLQRSSQRVPLWQVDRALAAGTVLAAGDVHLAEVAIDRAGAYVPAGATVVGRVLGRDVVAGELLSTSALRVQRRPPHLVGLAVEPAHVPHGVQRGARVAVLGTSEDGPTTVVLPAALVHAVGGTDVAGRVAIVLAVAPRDALSVVAAQRHGAIDLVVIGEQS